MPQNGCPRKAPDPLGRIVECATWSREKGKYVDVSLGASISGELRRHPIPTREIALVRGEKPAPHRRFRSGAAEGFDFIQDAAGTIFAASIPGIRFQKVRTP